MIDNVAVDLAFDFRHSLGPECKITGNLATDLDLDAGRHHNIASDLAGKRSVFGEGSVSSDLAA